MTIAKTDARKQYAGDDVTTAFAFPYRFFADSDLQVYLLVDATGVETLQTLTTHYTVSNNGDETGGTVTMLTEPAAGETLTILRAIPQTQGTDYAANDPFPAETHEAALDRLTLLTQQLEERMDRALIAPASDSASVELPIDRASSFLAFDASKNPIASAGTTEVLVSTFMETLLDDTTAAAGRTTLGASGLVDHQWEFVEDTYDFAMDGTVTSVETANFEDGYEYMFLVEALTSVGAGGEFLEMEFYGETFGNYKFAYLVTNSNSSGTDDMWGSIELNMTRVVSKIKQVSSVTHADLNLGTSSDGGFSVNQAETSGTDLAIRKHAVIWGTAQKHLRARFSIASGGVDGGKIIEYRRALT